MGLDTVELLMEIEEAFDLTIPNADAERLTTIGETYHYILARLGSDEADPGAPCKSAVAFYRFRRALIEVCGVERGLVRPATPMADLIAVDGRRAAWDRLGSTLGWSLPPLEPPAGYMRDATILAALASASIVIAALAISVPPLLFPPLLLVVFVAILIAIHRAMLPFTTRFPASDSTLRGMLSHITISNAARIGGDSTRSIPAGWVWDNLVAVVAEQCGVRAETLTEDTSFVYDLGMD